MRYGSVCSGIEAATVAWHPLDWQPAFFAEIEKFPSAVLAHRYPNVPNWGDITKFKEWPDAAIDVLVGGTPCQSFSVAGLRQGLADPRGNLCLTFLAIADRYRPQWLLWENVPGVLSSDGGRDFGAFLGGLGQLGYGWSYRVLDAQYVRVDGFERAVPQRRRRVFVVGYLGDYRRAAAVLFERESLSGHPAPRRQAGERVAPTISARPTGGGGLGTGFDCDGGLVHCAVATETLTAKYASTNGAPEVDAGLYVPVAYSAMPMNSGKDYTVRETDVARPLVPVAFDSKDLTLGSDGATSTLTTNGNENHAGGRLAIAFNGRMDPISGPVPGAIDTDPLTTCVAFSCKDHGADVGETSPTLRAMGHDGSHANAGGQVAVAFQSSQSGVRVDAVHATLDSNNGSRRHNGVVKDWAVRRLTPVECERLQGFPDEYTNVPWRGKNGAPDGPRYKALGNSMACNCMRWIGRRIEMVDAL